MKPIILSVLLSLIAFSAHANCGPELEVGPEFSITDDNTGYKTGLTTEASIGIKLVMPIGKNADIGCEELKANIAEKNAETMQERIRNLERIVNICNKNWITSLCNRINELAAEIGTE